MNKKILILNAEMDKINLSDSFLAYRFEIAELSKEAKLLNWLHKESVDLVILNISMTQILTKKICARIKETQKVPILLLAKRGEIRGKIHLFFIGADDYLTKPFQADKLLFKSQELIRRNSI